MCSADATAVPSRNQTPTSSYFAPEPNAFSETQRKIHGDMMELIFGQWVDEINREKGL
jgi:hypothetical protein